MKNYRLIIFALAVLGMTSCQQVDSNSTASNENLKQIASNFRSESFIVIEKGTEDYMGQFDHREFLEDILEAIYAGKIQAFDFMDNPLSIEDIKYLESHKEIAEVEDFETGEIDTVLIEEVLNPDDVVKIFTAEDWFLDMETFRIEKRVISVTLTTLKLDLEGDPIGYEILFKVYFDGRDQFQ